MKNKLAKIQKKLQETLHDADSFGHPISLNYKNETEYRSAFGGFITLLILIGLSTFLGILL